MDVGEHRLKDIAEPQRLHQLTHSDLPAEFPPPRSLGVMQNNLPAQLTTFIGRDAEAAELTALLTSARAVTLTGVGGCGKTRLALYVAESLTGLPGRGFVDRARFRGPTIARRWHGSGRRWVAVRLIRPVLGAAARWLLAATPQPDRPRQL